MMSEPKEPTEQEQQAAAHWYMVYTNAHEVGVLAQRQLEKLNALPDGQRLFSTRKERRRGMPK